jgi:heat shock protein HslJ/LysM repeat protein
MMKRLPITLTILILAALLVPATSMAQEPVACESNYTVQVGDWLSKIAEKDLGNVLAYPAIVAATNTQTDDTYATITNPDLIEPGWTLCIPSADDAATLMAMSVGTAPEGLSPEELANAEYKSEWTQDGTAQLVDGEFSEPAAPGSATMTTVTLQPQYTTYSQLNGQDAAAVVLVTDPGGSGTFFDLHVVVSQDGVPVDVASTPLGDRVQINSISIKDNQIVVDMVQAGPDDPMCCPSQQVVKTYELQGEQLMETSSQVMGAEAGPAGTLEGTSWILTALNGAAPLPDTTVTASFEADGNLSGSDGCNRYGASYEVDGDKISITPGMTTMMACPDPIMQQAGEYMVALASATSYQIQGDTLELLDAGGNAVATFTAQPTSLPGTSWTVIGYNNGKGGVVSVIIGTELTAVFGEDGTLSGSAGCNNYTAAYEADDDGNIAIGPAATTRKMCPEPEGIMEQESQYLAALETAATYRMEGERLELRTADGALAADFMMAK